MSKVLIIEPYYGGSHKQLIEILKHKLPEVANASCYIMTAKKWHWRARVSALQMSCQIPSFHDFEVLFCSSVLNLTELCGLRPEIGGIKKKVIYFHENQLVYPIQNQKDRDFQYGYNQITSAMTADLVLFNSEFNMKSFLTSINSFLNIMPDFKVKNIDNKIRSKCSVLYFPIEKPLFERDNVSRNQNLSPCHIVWPHRWEHDKNPSLLFRILFELKKSNYPFRLSVVGEQFSEVPTIFQHAKSILADNIDNWGFIDDKNQYYKLLNCADVVVSTADHEFYGVAMIEAASYGCVAVCPRKLSYPEIFDEMERDGAAHFYNTEKQLEKILKKLCTSISRGFRKTIDYDQRFKWLGKFWWNEDMLRQYKNIFSLVS